MGDILIGASDFVSERKGKLHETYTIGEVLGEGGFGIVKKITHKLTKEVRAVKIIDKSRIKSESDRNAFFNEVSIQKSLDHPNITKLYEYFQDAKSYYLICEVCTGGELFDKIISSGSFSESQAASYMKDILSVISYCHSKKIVHRDLKPENFLLDTTSESAHLKAIDFGASSFFVKGQKMKELIGTPDYMSPELISKKYTEKCDEWSAGVIMYILLSGGPPFHGESQEEIFKHVKTGKVDFKGEEWSGISKDAKDLIRKLLEKNSEKRITAAQAQKHKWFKNAPVVPLDPATHSKFMSNLTTFSSEMKLQKATYSFIASQLSSKHEKEEIYKIFRAIDTDGNGVLSREELIEGFGQLYSEEVDDVAVEVDKIMANVDIDKSGEISYTEFVAACMQRHVILSKEKLKAAFNMFDIDKNGTIEANELKAILGKGSNYTEKIWSDAINEVDTNGDGVIDFKEFCNMMLK